MAVSKGRAKDFKDPDEKVAKDYDPESNAPASDPGSDSDFSEDENAGTEHYVSVGKSRLRQKEGVSLGRDYRGSRVSRSALEEDSEEEEGESDDDAEYDDPETVDLAADEAQAGDSEIESDNALAESDAEQFSGFTFRGSSTPGNPTHKSRKRDNVADLLSSYDAEGGHGDEEDSSEGARSDSEDAGDSEDEDSEGGSDAEDDAAEERSDDGKADVEKGMAIQKQRNIYDGLLNLRIRLQKALVAANTFPIVEDEAESDSEPYEAAEEAAIKLLNTISSLRSNLAGPHRAGDKRKRQLAVSMPSEAIWARLQEEDLSSIEFRKSRLEKWSRKVQSVNVTAQRGLGQRSKTVVDALEEQLANPESRLVKRTRVPRSCAPAQASRKISEDGQVYDDADFYQLLLKELVDQRTVETAAAQVGGVPTVMLTAAKEAKTRKQVDRKASKGRKMRFTVHEKLQNFMAPEDRRSWEQDAVDRFFATLFGRKMELNEDDSADDGMEDVDAEEEGLRLFRN
ncbi:apoptosis antagonizing transcription factor domain-containing protein [Hirsutella rhossiliensis]|uniref:Protein BFR2 n=1 Tax=Hirsutella rhossiliensis TaxID=111463 RepID=A0A9P8MV31_9HYPO|nr:apoptosis antagonizing transcription factor domain-containing protein [Hirsutella rhossiliensis]KAH0961567.1 apoptosis antagonizing transcription factor domain-containing protein [Hirsutella rhossiliensis]